MKGFIKWVIWLIAFIAAFVLAAVISEAIGNGVVIVIAFMAIAIGLFLKYFKGRKDD